MGMIRCPIHGLTFIQVCCEHIGDAVAENRYEHANAVFDTYDAPLVLCDACFPKAKRPPGVRRNRSSSYWASESTSHTPCSEHFKEWYAGPGR